jgi:DNA-binding NtrC family response regulator
MLSRDEEKHFKDKDKDDCHCRTDGYQVKCQSRCASPPIEPHELRNLTERLRFFLNEGHIWIDQERAAIIHMSTLSGLRHELIDKVGIREARGLLTRTGYIGGVRDAAGIRKIHPAAPIRDMFLEGLKWRMLQGVAVIEPVKIETTGKFFAELVWRESFEAENNAPHTSLSNASMCWIQVGYLCGYASAMLGRTILFREVECRGAGGAVCRVIGKPIEEWDDPENDIEPLQPEVFANRFVGRSKANALEVHDRHRNADFDLVGASNGFTMACHYLKKVAKTDATVLFLGETGVGKEVFARTLHAISRRATKPFIAVNCGAIPENLVEAELFGVEKGAYTGASGSRVGRFERANGGTLFLDEVTTLSAAAQTKLLRAIQEREIERVGDTRSRPIDIRILAATNINLSDAVKSGQFRQDLYYRLNVFPIVIPPLRERRDDIPLLIDHFLHRFSLRYGRALPSITTRAVVALCEYDFPGNVRELENIIERAVIMAGDDDQPIDLSHLFMDGQLQKDLAMRVGLSGTLERDTQGGEAYSNGLSGLVNQVFEAGLSLDKLEDAIMHDAVKRADGNLSRASRLLGITRPQLAYRLRRT